MRALLALAFVLFSALPALAEAVPSAPPPPAACEAGFAINPETNKCQSIVSPAPAQVARSLIDNPGPDKLACKVDSDCRIFTNICGKPMPVNKENMFDFVAAANKARMEVQCNKPQDFSNIILTVGCLDQQCIVSNPYPAPAPDDQK